MKIGVILVGSHHVGKSKTIREYVKPKLGIGIEAHIFNRNEQQGFILSQSFEEANRDIADTISRYSHYELLVLSARPTGQHPSCLTELTAELENAGYIVNTVDITAHLEDSYYDERADEVIGYLDGHQVSLEFAATS